MPDRLMIPGPTPVPQAVLAAMARPMINHRSPAFAEIIQDCTQGAKWLYQTANDVLMLTCSGTGGLEAAVANVLSPGDRVLALVTGVFGQRFADIAQAYGGQVDRIEWPIGAAYDWPTISAALESGPYHVVLMTHNETSTTVLNPLGEVVPQLRRELPDALFLVDSVSGLGTSDLPVDTLDLDIVVAGSQKAFMLPPGLAFLSVSERAWAAQVRAKAPRFYFDLAKAKSFASKGQTPWTPAVSVLFAMQESLRLLRQEGLHEIFSRHERLAGGLRAGIRSLGMELLVADDRIASRAVTGVYPPSGVSPGAFRKLMQQRFSVVLAGGQGALADSIFRVGHLGHVDALDIFACLAALELALNELGAKLDLGKGVGAAQDYLAERSSWRAAAV